MGRWKLGDLVMRLQRLDDAAALVELQWEREYEAYKALKESRRAALARTDVP